MPTGTLKIGPLVSGWAVAANPCILANHRRAPFAADPAGTAKKGTVVSRARTFGHTGRVVEVTAHTSRVLGTVSTTTTRMFRLTLARSTVA